jgi:hypothetical protein
VRLWAVESRTVRSRTEGMWASGVVVVAADLSDSYSRQVCINCKESLIKSAVCLH